MNEITSKKLDELIKDSRALVVALKKKGDRSHELLAEGLYKKRTHFITELLQNAEDEGARHVSFILDENELVFSHDAPHLFDFDDIKSISNFGDNQKKKDKPNAIGRFGIGFKSVYTITKTPRIISGDFDITIQDMCVPEKSNHQFEYSKDTKIILPLKDIEKENIAVWLESEFNKFDVLCLLFLSNITTIEWCAPNSKGKYEKIEDDKQVITLRSDTISTHFLIFEKNINIGNKVLVIKIAFKLNENKNALIPCDKSPLFAFFPTSDETNASFLLHAPFHTTESRDTLDEIDGRNNKLLNELGILLAESLLVFKKRNFINVDFLNMLPIDKTICFRSNIYNILYDAVIDEFKKDANEFIPSIEKNTYCSAKDAMLLGSAELSELLTGKQANVLFGRNKWISSDITENKTETKKLYQYLSELGIPNYDLRIFATKITEDFLVEQSNNWIVKFYKTVFQKAEGLWEKNAKNPVLRKKPIIRIEEQGKYRQIMPFTDDDKPNAYLPIDSKTNYCTVLRSIANDRSVVEFLKAFGLDYPDVFAEINEFILPKLKTGEIYDGYLDDILAILAAPKEKAEKYRQLTNDLNECKFILGENYITHEKKLLKYSNVYFPSEVLVKYFCDNRDIYFVSSFNSFDGDQKDKYNKLLKELGVKSVSPQRVKIDSGFTDSEKRKLLPISNNYKFSCFDDFDLEGLSNFFENVTKERSIALWEMLIKEDDTFFKGKAKYYYRYDYTYSDQFDAKFLRDLRKTKWLFVGEDSFAPSEIAFEELSDDYKKDVVSIQGFVALLNFKLDEDKEYEMKHKGKKVVNEDELEKLRADSEELQRIKTEKEAMESAKKDKLDDELEFKPDINPADALIRLSLYNPTKIFCLYDECQGNALDNNINGNDNKNEGKTQKDNDVPATSNSNSPDNSEFMKGIGRWGEDYIARVLYDEYKNEDGIKIIDLNSEGKIGVGADFEVWNNGNLIRLVEVKTTTGPKGSPVIVSGTQWEIARNFYKLNNGDLYWIYCVYNAGGTNVQCVPVQNPINQWKEGTVIADPINFVIKVQ